MRAVNELWTLECHDTGMFRAGHSVNVSYVFDSSQLQSSAWLGRTVLIIAQLLFGTRLLLLLTSMLEVSWRDNDRLGSASVK